MEEIFVIERLLAPGVWVLAGDAAYTTEHAAVKACTEMSESLKRISSRYKNVKLRATKLLVKVN